MSRFLIVLSLATALATLKSCSCPPAPTLQRYADWDFTSTEGCLEYFRMAVLDKNAYHILLCLSADAKRRENLTVANVHTFRDDIVAELEEKVGPIEDIEIGEPRFSPGQPFLALVQVSGGGKSETVTLVKEVSAFVTYQDPDREPQVLLLPFGTSVSQAAARHPQLADRDVYRVEYEQGWRIDGVTNTSIQLETPPPPGR